MQWKQANRTTPTLLFAPFQHYNLNVHTHKPHSQPPCIACGHVNIHWSQKERERDKGRKRAKPVYQSTARAATQFLLTTWASMKIQTFCCIPNRNAVQNSTCLRCTAWFCCTTPYCNSFEGMFFFFVPCYRRASPGSTVFYCSFSCRPPISACAVRSPTTHGSWGRRRNSNMYFYAKKVFYDSGRVLWRAQLWGPFSCISQMVSVCCKNCVRHKSVLNHLWTLPVNLNHA